MALTKIFSPSGWGWDMPTASLLKVGSDMKLRFHDRKAFEKRAGVSGAHIFGNLDHVKFAQDEIPVHLIAVGAKEAWGANRNGDAFTEFMLKKAHDTFVKYAFWFRNHKNKPHLGDPKYGLVKASAYNPDMRRVELLCGLPTTKAAADRAGVLFPDKELEKLARDEDIAVSMACRVPFDVCSGCNNRAATRDDYCKEASCRYGGCDKNLARLIKIGSDVHHLHVENDNPIFFDISNVWRPADRTAYAGRADWVKAACDGGFFGEDGAKTAADLGVIAPMHVILAQDNLLPGEWTPYMTGLVKLARGLAALDQQPGSWASAEVRRAFAADMQPDLDLQALGLNPDHPEKMAGALGALADQHVVLPLREFARMTKRADLADAAGKCMRGVYYRMMVDGSLEKRLANNPYAPAEKLATDRQRLAAAKVAPTHSLEKTAVARRCNLSAVRGKSTPDSNYTIWNEKTAHDSADVEKLARDYACYKVAALERIAAFDTEFTTTAKIAACQNQVV